MKNFRKSIIALATAAAMLIPSVAMAATFTTQVESSKIAASDNVYVGFYENEVLKDVVKTTVDAVAVADTKLQAEELPAKVTVENVKVANRSTDNAEVYKLVFKFNDSTSNATITSTGLMLSFDNTIIQPVLRQGKYTSLTYDQITSNETYMTASFLGGTYEDIFGDSVAFTTKAMWTKSGNRTAVAFDTVDTSNTGFEASGNNMFTEFYYIVLDDQEVTADTFALEVTGDFADTIGNPGDTKAIAVGTDYWFGRVKGGVAQEDTISFGGFPFAPAEEEIEMTTLTVSTEKNVAGYKAKMFIWDADQIAKVAPIELN